MEQTASYAASGECNICGRAVDPKLGCTYCLLNVAIASPDASHGSSGIQVNPDTTFDHYQVLSHSDGTLAEIGRGGMGVTYKAFDRNLRVYVALKVISDALIANRALRERFLREARQAAQLRHPNVASVLHLGSVGDRCFYAMEFVEGESVEQLVQRSGPVEPAFALRIAAQVASALSAASKLKLVHRDIKPANLMLQRNEAGELTVKLIDFGIALSLDPETPDATDRLTRAGIVGTVQFASPEQLRHEPVDTRSDIYSLGVTIWYMLAGAPPFKGTHTQVLNHQLNAPPPLEELRTQPECVIRLLKRMLEKDPARRVQSPEDLQREIGACLASLTSGNTYAARSWARRKVLVRCATALLVLSAAGLLTYTLISHPRRPPPSSTSAKESIAVLPFRADASDAAATAIAEGIHNEVLTTLARKPELKVISHGSVDNPRLNAMTPEEKGKTLGVTTLLEGSLQHVGNRFRVNSRLVEAHTGKTIHARTFEAGETEVFRLQNEIAQDALAQLAPDAPEANAKAPTASIAAYETYLRARDAERQPENEMGTNARKAAELYEEAVKLDPNFALAEVRLAYLYARLYWQEDDWQVKPTYLRKAQAAVEHALKLQPDLPEAHAALGYYYYYGHRDYTHALAEFERAQQQLPNDPEIAEAMGLVQRRTGAWDESIASLVRATQLDPLNARFLTILEDTYDGLRRYDEAEDVLARERALVPRDVDTQLDAALVHWKKSGSSAELRQLLDRTDPATDSDTNAMLRWDINMMDRRYDAALNDLARERLTKYEAAAGIFPRELLYALTYWCKGDFVAAKPYFEQSRAEMEPAVEKDSQGGRLRVTLALAYAGLGLNDQAIHHGMLATDERSMTKDAVAGPPIAITLARIYTMVGENDKAIDLLSKLLVMPFGLSKVRLQSEPIWDPLRKDPRFQQLLTAPAR